MNCSSKMLMSTDRWMLNLWLTLGTWQFLFLFVNCNQLIKFLISLRRHAHHHILNSWIIWQTCWQSTYIIISDLMFVVIVVIIHYLIDGNNEMNFKNSNHICGVVVSRTEFSSLRLICCLLLFVIYESMQTYIYTSYTYTLLKYKLNEGTIRDFSS